MSRMSLWYVVWMDAYHRYLANMLHCQANHTSYLDYILLGAHKFPHAVVMARHTGALGKQTQAMDNLSQAIILFFAIRVLAKQRIELPAFNVLWPCQRYRTQRLVRKVTEGVNRMAPWIKKLNHVIK